jgi:antitoxin VapB
LAGIYYWYILLAEVSAVNKIAKLFPNGSSQAVRLPREFRFSGTEVRISRHGRGVLLEPVELNVDDWFADLDRFAAEPFMPDGRNQPAAPSSAGFE